MSHMPTTTTFAPGTHVPPEAVCNDSDEAWMLMATVLVLGMFPGVAFFEAGLLRHKTTTTILAQVFCGLAMLSVMWFSVGYTLTFSPSAESSFIGDMNNAFFINVDFDDCATNDKPISTGLYALFQLMFACITPLLMTGAYAERLAWTPFVIFTLLWEVLVYYPVAHWMWAPQGWLAKMGALDFAGGIVIHTTAGVSSLVAVLILGRRSGFHKNHGVFPYSSLSNASIGAALLWTGWFGFNGGSALAANSSASHAVANSQIGAVFAACSYMLVIMYMTRRPSTIAILNGAIAGLAGVTPASGYISPQASMVLGVLLGVSAEPAVHLLRHKFHIDDALDVSVVHGLTGVIGSLFIGFCGTRQVFAGMKYEGVLYHGDGTLLGLQALAVLVCGAWAGFWSFVILRGIKFFMPLRVSEDFEHQGMDVTVFKERSVNVDPGESFATNPVIPHAEGGAAVAAGADANGSGAAAHAGAAGWQQPLFADRHDSPRRESTVGSHPPVVGANQLQFGGATSNASFSMLESRLAETHGECDPLRPEEPTEAEQMLAELRTAMAASTASPNNMGTRSRADSRHSRVGDIQ